MPRADALAGGATGHEATLPLERARLVRLCLQLTGDVDAAEDLAQETLYEAWRHRHRVHDPRGLHRWLAAIARHVCRRWAQRRGRDISRRLALSHGEGEDGDAPREGLTDAFDVEVELERRELVDLLDRAMALLPPPTRAALVQRYVEASPVAEVAVRLGLSEGAVAMRLQRGKLALRRLLTTAFARDAVAYGLLEDTDGTWQETRIWCYRCGARRLQGLLDHRLGLLLLRCPGCNAAPGDRMERTVDERMFATVKGYRPAYSRVLAFVAGNYQRSLRQNPMPCPSCRRPVLVHPGIPEGWYGVFYSCAHCRHGASTGFGAIILGLPEGRRFWREHPRIRLLPYQEVEVAGSPAYVITYESVTNRDRLDVIATRDTCRLIGVYGPSSPAAEPGVPTSREGGSPRDHDPA